MKTKLQLMIAVRKFLKMNRLFLISILVGFLVTGCQKVIWVPAVRVTDMQVNQKSETTIQPAKYYICGNTQYPCRPVTNKRQKATSHHIAKQRTGSRKNSTLLINKPKEQHHEAPVTVKSCKINQDKL